MCQCKCVCECVCEIVELEMDSKLGLTFGLHPSLDPGPGFISFNDSMLQLPPPMRWEGESLPLDTRQSYYEEGICSNMLGGDVKWWIVLPSREVEGAGVGSCWWGRENRDRKENEDLETQAWLKTPVSILYLSQCLAFQGQKGVLCGSDLLSVFPIAGLISVSHSGTCCRGAVYYRLIKAVNDNGNPVSNLRYYPDLSLPPSSHQAIKVTSFREHSHLPSVSPLMLFSWEELRTFLGWVTWRYHWQAYSSPSRVCSTHETWGFSLSLSLSLF